MLMSPKTMVFRACCQKNILVKSGLLFTYFAIHWKLFNVTTENVGNELNRSKTSNFIYNVDLSLADSFRRGKK
jgi:hypothetical protein